jgi:hypothetical protein
VVITHHRRPRRAHREAGLAMAQEGISRGHRHREEEAGMVGRDGMITIDLVMVVREVIGGVVDMAVVGIVIETVGIEIEVGEGGAEGIGASTKVVVGTRGEGIRGSDSIYKKWGK